MRILNWSNMINWVWARINTHPINHLLRMIIWVLVLLRCNQEEDGEEEEGEEEEEEEKVQGNRRQFLNMALTLMGYNEI